MTQQPFTPYQERFCKNQKDQIIEDQQKAIEHWKQLALRKERNFNIMVLTCILMFVAFNILLYFIK